MRLPICGCGRIMNCTKTGLSVLTHSEDGLEYQLWASDEYTCPNCHAKVALVSSAAPIAEHWQPGFDRAKRNANTPDGRLRLFKAYYGARLEAVQANVAGVLLGPIVQDAIDSHLRAAGITPASPASSVDSTTQQAQTPDTTAAPPAAAPEK